LIGALFLAAAIEAGSGADATPPVLLAPPTTSQLVDVWPAAALTRHIGGVVSLDCEITPAGKATDCKIARNVPYEPGFGPAALRLAPGLDFRPAQGPHGPQAARLVISICFTLSPNLAIDVRPTWAKRPSGQEFADAYPFEAMVKGISGSALLDCEADIHGALDDCRVDSESPPGMQFGLAALSLSSRFLMKPAIGPAGPVASRVNIPIRFEIGGAQPALAVAPTQGLVVSPAWIAAPNFAQVAQAYPRRKAGDPMTGSAVVRCQVQRDGRLKYCVEVAEDPKGQGFARAATRLGPFFRLDTTGITIKPGSTFADVKVQFVDPTSAAFRDRRIGQPRWVVAPDPARAIALFPAKALAKGLTTGLGTAACRVSASGALDACRPAAGDPPDDGFSEAAVELASQMRMAPWTDGGGPVDGAFIDVPIRFRLEARPPKPATPSPPPVPGR
jgi:TonB family protein